MIYQFDTHNIYIEEHYKAPTFSLTISMLEIVVEYTTRQILYVEGYLPLIRAIHSNIELPQTCSEKFVFDNIDISKIRKYEVFRLSDKMPECICYFEKDETYFDPKKGIIKIGDVNNQNSRFVKVNKNLIVGHDNGNILNSLYIIPDKFVE